jgi:hypothetical protein
VGNLLDLDFETIFDSSTVLENREACILTSRGCQWDRQSSAPNDGLGLACVRQQGQYHQVLWIMPHDTPFVSRTLPLVQRTGFSIRCLKKNIICILT